jgi:glycolate oxidase FAD binding subunit
LTELASNVLRPADEAELAAVIADASTMGRPLELIGKGTKRSLGRPCEAVALVELSRLSGIVDYAPEELVLTARPGTPLAEIARAVSDRRQMLAFEPPTLGPLLLGAETQHATLGGTLACNLSGPRRIKAGAARDHFLGFRAVNGRGEIFKAGGKVVKNVTGYDLCKLVAGSYGTLAALSEVTIKVLPAPEKTRTVLVFGLSDEAALRALTTAMASPHEVSGAAHLPAPCARRSALEHVRSAGAAVTALRVEGVAPSVEARCATLRELLGRHGAIEELHSMRSTTFWREVGEVAPLIGDLAGRVLWRLSVAPASGAAAIGALRTAVPELGYVLDWAGGLVWAALPAAPDAHVQLVRQAAARAGGYATLIRAPAEARATVAVFEPADPAIAALTRRLKDSFDPRAVLNRGRMYAGI